MQIRSTSRAGNSKHGVGRCDGRLCDMAVFCQIKRLKEIFYQGLIQIKNWRRSYIAYVQTGTEKLALLPRQACMPPAIDLASVFERVKVALETITYIDHRLVANAQRSITGGQ